MPICRSVLKEVLQSGLVDAAFRAVLSVYIDLVNSEIAAAEAEERPVASWVTATQDLLGRVEGWIAVFEGGVRQLFRSPLDFLLAATVWSDLHTPGVLDDPVAEILQIVDEVESILGNYDPEAQGSLWPAAEPVGGGLFGSLGDIERRILSLRIGATPWSPDRALRSFSSSVLLQVIHGKRTFTGIPWASSQGARRGLESLTLLVVHGAERNARPSRSLTNRLRRALERLDSDAGRKAFLEEFDELYQFAKSDAGVLHRLQSVALNFASPSTKPLAARNHAKGAAMQIHVLWDTKQAGKLALNPDHIEPLALASDPTKALRAWWDMREGTPASYKYVECKNWASFADRSKRIGRQLGRHITRDKVWSDFGTNMTLSKLKPIALEYPAGVSTPPKAETIIDEVVAKILEKANGKPLRLGWNEYDVRSWVKVNFTLEDVDLPYDVP